MTRTLSSFEWLLKSDDNVINCPLMFLDEWHDGNPPIFEGAGRIALKNSSEISFQLDAKPRSLEDAISALRRSVEQPYEPVSAMRLRGIDHSGTEWNAGWVRPRVGDVQGGYWQLYGESGGLSTGIQQISPAEGVELVYSPAPDVPFSELMKTSASLSDLDIARNAIGGRHQMELLGSEIEVIKQPRTEELWICATTSDHLRHPYLENWLSEPLRALRGQLIFPRLVARNFKDGRSFVSVRPAPALRPSMGGCNSQLCDRSASEFWSFYGHYLSYVALHRNSDGHPEFEANGLTRLHDEVIQARMAGSPWVIALCVASAIEGIVKLDPELESTPPDFTADELAPVECMVRALEPEALRNRLRNAVSQFGRASIAKYLAKLERQGLISKSQLRAWRKIRNQVAHGNLFAPWGTLEERTQLEALVTLLYRLTCVRISYRSF